ncbi:MAG: DUF1932 domain-containing protein [Alphaproteobacteria bacterium]
MTKQQLQTVAIMAPGDMGHSVGAVLRHHGMRVITNLDGRSERSRDFARVADMEDVGSDVALVEEADVLLSILVPARAVELAERIAATAKRCGADLLYVDANALAPQTTQQIGKIVEDAGLSFADAGIVGPPPCPGSEDTRIYVSGPQTEILTALGAFGLDIRVVGDVIGEASAVKMCYAALNKGLIAVATQISVAAKVLGVEKTLWEEFAASQSALVPRMQLQLPFMVPKAYRWVGEMEEIAKTFETCGLSPKIFLGAAETFDFVTGAVGPNPEKSEFEPLVDLLAKKLG